VFLVATEWEAVEFQRGDDNRIGLVWVVVLEHDLEFLGVGEAGLGVLGIVGMDMGRSGGRGGALVWEVLIVCGYDG
jgi:hypothetical protein